MTTYGAIWRVVLACLAALALAAGAPVVGWVSIACGAVALACLGVVWGFYRDDDGRPRVRIIVSSVFWFALGGVVLIGLPPVLGAWTLPVLLGLAATCPLLVGAVLDASRRKRVVRPTAHPERLSDKDLVRRWRASSQELRVARHHPSMAVLRLVQERALLLEELERRDPERFDDLLVRAGWREREDHQTH